MSKIIYVVCRCCGLPTDLSEDALAHLWDLQARRIDGRQNNEALVYSSDDLYDDPDWLDDRENSGPWLAMGRNMAERGLCPECGLPDLRGMTEDDFYSEEEYEDMCDMWAEQAAERRAGC